MHGHQRDDLRDIERRTAAKADDPVGAVGAIGRDALVDLASDRVAVNAGVDPDSRPSEPMLKSARMGSVSIPVSVTINGRLTPTVLR
jgi:hypothetical protein